MKTRWQTLINRVSSLQYNLKRIYYFSTVALIYFVVSMSCSPPPTDSQGDNFNANIDRVAAQNKSDAGLLTFFDNQAESKQPQFQLFPSGSVMPLGWIRQMMIQDLEMGIVGKLDELYPGIKSDDLYHTARRGGMSDIPEMGDLELTGAAWEKSIMWWNAETIGNWWDGYIRHAFLTQNEIAINKSHAIVNNLLDSQDPDGYIGIYKPNLRYQHEGSNGELWAQTTAFRTLLAYYEFTGRSEVLEAVERAMQVTMDNYNDEKRNPFDLENAFGGVTHGLMMTDVCETLFRITNKMKYQDYASYLYRAFSTFSINRSFNDLRYPFLMEKDSLFEGHAVHTYEHIRSVINASYNSDHPELATATENMLHKLQSCILPSGAGHGNEWIARLQAHPDHTATEYCAMLELRNSYLSLFQKTGNIHHADQAEKITYNAMLGSRNRHGTAICYGKPDNCYALDGTHTRNGQSQADPRYKYSPTHSEPAVCCVPNYGRNFPYFLDMAWMKATDGIAAVSYGPSRLSTSINGSSITIEQQTNYPLSDKVMFRFKLDQPTAFTFYLRKPNWSEKMNVSAAFDILDSGFYQFKNQWKNGDSLEIRFVHRPQVKAFNDNEYYVQHGPIVFAYSIPHREEVIKSYEIKGFTDYYCLPTDEGHVSLTLNPNAQFELIHDQTPGTFYDMEWKLKGSLYDTKSADLKTIELLPMGKLALRRVTFPRSPAH